MVIYTWREVFEAVRGEKRRKKKRNAERKRSLKANASAEYEGGEAVQYLPALTEKQQW